MNTFAQLDAYDQDYMRLHGVTPLSDVHWPDPLNDLIFPPDQSAPELTDDKLSAVFGDWAPWLKSAAEVKGAPVDYVALSLVSAASALIGNTRRASPWSGWVEPTIVWSMLVGHPSSGKSPAMDAVLDIIKEIGRELDEQYKAERSEWSDEAELAAIALAQWKADVKTAIAEGKDTPSKPAKADAGPEPIRGRVAINDATTEKIGDLLSSTWRGLLLIRDELAGWLSSMDRYSGGGDRPFWLEAYGGRSYSVDRKSRPEPIVIDHLSVSVVGGTQPDRLESLLLKTDDDGLLARFLIAFPSPAPLTRPTKELDVETAITAFKRLYGLQPALLEDGKRPFVVPFSDVAANTLQDFRQYCRDTEQTVDGLLRGHVGKLPGVVIRVACVLAFLDWSLEGGPDITTIEDEHVRRACFYVSEHLFEHAKRAYTNGGASEEMKAARKLATIIREEDLSSFAPREIQRRNIAGLMNSGEINRAVAVLQDADWVRSEKVTTNGRPKTVIMVNPKVGRTA